jgi:hypothetical protein
MFTTEQIMRFIRRNLLLFSALVFSISALLLFIAFSQEKNALVDPSKPEIEPWLKVAEEILAGLMTASAVAFLYDWILKLETKAEMTGIIRNEIEGLKYSVKGADLDTQVDHLTEWMFLPIAAGDDSEEGLRERFCRLSIHYRSNGKYLGDEATFVSFPSGRYKPNNLPPNTLYFHELISPPSESLDKKWFDVTSLKVNGADWKKTEHKVENDMILVKFIKPTEQDLRTPQRVNYEFNTRTIERNVFPKTLNYYVRKRMINTAFRVDARAIRAQAVNSRIAPEPDGVVQGPCLGPPEGEGTCQMFVGGPIEGGATVTFEITG